MSEQIRFDSIFDQSFLDKVYARFKLHIKERTEKTYFSDIIEKELFIGNEKENIRKILNNLQVDMTDKDVMKFLEANAYRVCIPLMSMEGHEFNQVEKTFIAGFCMFADCISCDETYPFTRPEEQVDEYLQEKISDDFISTSAKWNIESMVKVHKKEMNL